MKNINKLYTALMLLATLLIASCTKDDVIFTDNGAYGIVELSDLSSKTASVLYAATISKSYDASLTSVDLPITVNYTGADGAPEDINVILAVTDDVLASNNSAYTTSYTKMPTNLYSISSYTVTIPKGQKKATLIVKILPSSFTAVDLASKYAFGIKIVSASAGTVSSNYSAGLWAVSVKNKYDGVYTLSGSMVDYTASAYTGIYPQTVKLVTTSSNVVEVNYTYSSSYPYRYYFLNGTTTTYYGNWSPIFTFDTSTNAVTSVTNYYGQGTNTSVRSGQIDTSATYYYDSTTKKITIVYYLIQSGAQKAKFTEVYTYTGAR